MNRFHIQHLCRLVAACIPVALALFMSPDASAQGYGGTVYDMLVRGDILLSQGRYNESIVQFQESRTLCPTPAQEVQSLEGEARARRALGELLQAVGLFEEAATRFPEHPRVPDLLYAAGAVSHRAGVFGRSVDLLRRALDADPTPDVRALVRFQLSQSLRLQGRQGEVIDVLSDFEAAFPEHPLLPRVLYTLAIAQHDLGNYPQAEEIFRTILSRFPGSQAATETYFELGKAIAAQGRNREAADFFRQYVELSPGSPVAARAFERAGDMMLFRSPRTSAEYYALAGVKAGVNPIPLNPTLRLSNWFETKQKLAWILSRWWMVVLVFLFVIGVPGSLVWWFLWWRRRLAAAA